MKRKALTLLLILLLAGLGTLLFGDRILDIYHDLTFNWDTATEAEKTVKTFAEEQGISYSRYPGSLIDLLDRNPETEEFVLGYFENRDRRDPIRMSEFDRTQGVPLMMQWDTRWAKTTWVSLGK